MLSIVSVGIKDYIDSEMKPIICADSDAKKIYESFKLIMGEEFADSSSMCLKNLSAIEFIYLLESLKFIDVQDTDTIVLYFSGHACPSKTYSNKPELVLCFSDYSNNSLRGYVSLEHTLIPIVDKICCNIVIILDCCYAGEALKFASNMLGDNRIAVLAAVSDRGLAEFTSNGSTFTSAIVQCIDNIKNDNKNFTLRTLQCELMNSYKKSVINAGAGENDDICFKEKIDIYKLYHDFEKRFLSVIHSSNDQYKEFLWYSLYDFPDFYVKAIFNQYFRAINQESIYPTEPNWLVRRAIGSALSHINDKKYVREITQKLLKSKYWQEQCIGLIGARYNIKNDASSYDEVVALIKSGTIKKVDAVWLANLYASDNKNYDYRIFLKTILMQSNWGIQEVYKAARKHAFELNEFISNIDPDKQNGWKQIYLNPDLSENNSLLYQILSDKKERGRLPENSNVKLTLSILYGNWRGQIQANLLQLFELKQEKEIQEELKNASKYRHVEYRMAIFEHFKANPAKLLQYSEYLWWGLEDSHPWVRRTAIQAFKRHPQFKNDCNNAIVNYIKSDNYEIGELDLLLEYDADSLLDFQAIVNGIERYTKNDIAGILLKYK